MSLNAGVNADTIVDGGGNKRLAVDSIAVNTTGFIVPMINRVDVNTTETVSGNSSALESDGLGCINSQFEVTAISGASATIQFFLETSDDTTIWTSMSSTLRFTATGSQRFISNRLTSRYYRYRWVITGSTPSVDFKITTTLKAYLPRAHAAENRYGDLTMGTAGNLSTVFSARDTANISVMLVRPASPVGTGQFRVQASNDNVNFVDLTTNTTISNGETVLNTFSGRSFLFYRLIVGASGGGAAVCDIFWGASG